MRTAATEKLGGTAMAGAAASTLGAMGAPLPITVLGGYLGAGKTTLLNRVLAGANGRRIGVVVNDFGELGVDVALLADQAGDGLVDLPNGCVCCTLGTELGEVLDRLVMRRPALEQIVIEASGVADPATLAAWGTVPGLAPGGVFVIAAADSIRRLVDDRYVGTEVRRQLAAADLVIVTKADLVGRDALENVVRWLGRETGVPVVVADAEVADAEVAGCGEAGVGVAELVLGSPPDSAVASAPAGLDEVVPADHGAAYETWTWRPASDQPVDPQQLRRFVDALPSWTLRAKGIVAADDGALLVQIVGRSRPITPLDTFAGTHGIVVIGPAEQFDGAVLDDLATEHLA